MNYAMIFCLVLLGPGAWAITCGEIEDMQKEVVWHRDRMNEANGRIRALEPQIDDKAKIVAMAQRHLQSIEQEIINGTSTITDIENIIKQKHTLDALLIAAEGTRRALADDIESELNASADAPRAEKIIAAVNKRPIPGAIQTAFGQYLKNLKAIDDKKPTISYRSYLLLTLNSLRANTPAEIQIASHSLNLLLMDLRQKVVIQMRVSQQERETIQRDLAIAVSDLDAFNAVQNKNNDEASLRSNLLNDVTRRLGNQHCANGRSGRSFEVF